MTYICIAGLYRVNYDPNNWQLIANYLRSNNNNRQSIHKLNRAQVCFFDQHHLVLTSSLTGYS